MHLPPKSPQCGGKHFIKWISVVNSGKNEKSFFPSYSRRQRNQLRAVKKDTVAGFILISRTQKKNIFYLFYF